MTIEHTETAPRRKLGPIRRSSETYNSLKYYKCFQNYYHGHNFLKPNPLYITDVNVTIEHWQLRNLVQIDQRSGTLYYTKSDSIRGLELLEESRLRSRPLINLDYSPKCFHQAPGGIIASGGLLGTSSMVGATKVPSLIAHDKKTSLFGNSKGLFSFANPNMGVLKTYRVGEAINNAVSIYEMSNSQYKSFTCNNDSNLYEIDINNGDRISLTNKMVCENHVSLNNVCKSPANDKILTVTGDSPSIYLVDLSSNTRIKKIKTQHDSGFGISYHDNGNLFATTFQDGTCSLFDIRNLSEPVVETQSTRPGHQSGAFRSCKFSSTTANDLLVILEHVGRIHVLDLRSMSTGTDDRHQVIVFPLALDQFADFKKRKLEASEKFSKKKNPRTSCEDVEMEKEEDVKWHRKFCIYDDMDRSDDSIAKTDKSVSRLQFTAPLIYDCNYLSEINPRLFKNYTYHPPNLSENSPGYCPPPEFNYPRWNTDIFMSREDDSNDNAGQRFSAYQNESLEYSHIRNSSEISRHNEDEFALNNRPNSYYTQLYQDAYLNYLNHIHGEMEISGIDWFDKELYVGCENGGIIKWHINEVGRRSFGSFSYA